MIFAFVMFAVWNKFVTT